MQHTKSSQSNFAVTLTNIKNEVEGLLVIYCQEQRTQAGAQSDEYEELWKTITDIVIAGGKRIRPYLVFVSHELFGGKHNTTILPIATAQELLHISMLIHDDIIDRDNERHGKVNISGAYSRIYKPHVAETDLSHYAMSSALLAGDLLISGANDIILRSNISSAKKIKSLKVLHDSIFSVVGGELSDIQSSFIPLHNLSPIHIAHFKTAVYSFVNPLLTGGYLANAESSDLETLKQFGINTGIAFQLTDDLLGVFGDESKTGKSTLSDLQEGKGTYLIQQTLERISESDSLIFMKHFGNRALKNTDAKILRDIIERCGAKQATIDIIDTYASSAQQQLSQLQKRGFNTKKLEQLLHKLSHRES